MKQPSKASNHPDSEILIVDDDPGQRSLLTTFLTDQGFHPITVSSGEAALAQLGQSGFRMMISDVRMSGMSGLDTLREARQLHPTLPVLLVTAYADVKDAVGAMRDGAVNYLEKPIDLDELLANVRQAVGSHPSNPPKDDIPLDLPDHLIAVNPIVRQLYRDALRVAPSDGRILITGESGTGKASMAELIHQASPRSHEPIHIFSCAATSPELIDTRLFGSPESPGLLSKADGSTLVLHEIGEVAPATQAKLLQVTQTRSYYCGNRLKDCTTGARLIVTNKNDLTDKVTSGHFRDDLYFRLNVIELPIPPLRERQEDIVPLATAFLREYTQGHARFAPTVLPCLQNYPWKGNIRELRNAMERATLMAHGGLILPKHLPSKIQEAAQLSGDGEVHQSRKMADVERETILQTLRNNRNNRSETARILGISRRALTYKLQKYREEGYLDES